jgi:carbon monoxide dehydrogenase subunit G
MDMQGSRHLAVTQQQAWDALNDPEVLKTCIPGCDKVEATGENQYAIGMAVKIGPVSARFNGKILLTDVTPPDSYTLNFEGQGGAAGFGKGTAKVNLASTGEGCDLAYSAHAQVGGKIAQVGQRLVDGVARSMAEDFFRRFDEEMQRRYPQQAAAAAPPAEAEAATAPAVAPTATAMATPGKRMPSWVWVLFAAVVLLALLLLARRG